MKSKWEVTAHLRRRGYSGPVIVAVGEISWLAQVAIHAALSLLGLQFQSTRWVLVYAYIAQESWIAGGFQAWAAKKEAVFLLSGT